MEYLKLMSCEYDRARNWWYGNLILKTIILLITIVAIFSTKGDASLIIGIISILIPISAWYSEYRTSQHYGKAENMRRLLLLIDGLNIKPPEHELAQIEFDVGRIESRDPLYTPPYYYSALEAGSNRLADIISESSFFTKNLARNSSNFFGTLALIGLVAMFLLLYISFQMNFVSEIRGLISKVIAIMLIFFVTGDLSRLFFKFRKLSEVSEKVSNRCDKLRDDRNADRYDIFAAMDDYNCALIQAPPIPEFIYKKNRDALNDAWRRHRG